MPKVYITEFRDLPEGSRGEVVQIARNMRAHQVVAIGGSSVQSASVGNGTTIVRVHTDAICSIDIGLNPVATANTARLAADQSEYFGVNPGDKIAVITNS